MGIIRRNSPSSGAAPPDYSRIIVGVLAGRSNAAIARQLDVGRPTVQLWRTRVSERGSGEVWQIAPGRGRKPQYDQATREAILEATLPSKLAGMTHWSCRLMAKARDVSKSTVNWRLHNIKPHLQGKHGARKGFGAATS